MKHTHFRTKCPRPFDTLTIDTNGNCYACECSGWLPIPVGNIQINEIHQILKSDKLETIQETIRDGTFRYCNGKKCSYLLDPRHKKNWPITVPEKKIKNLRLGIDNSCNLSCPSCRNKIIFEKRGNRLRARKKMIDAVIRYIDTLDHKVTVHLGSDGDPFASLVYRYFLKNCPKNHNLEFSIQTNGLLFEKMYNKNKWFFDRCKTIGLSIDGCSKNVYEKLRRGGKFDILKNNLEFIKHIKQYHNFMLIFHNVIQVDNYHEMESYINFAKSYLADRVYFNRIVDWGTYENFASRDVANKDHELHSDFQAMLLHIKTKYKHDLDSLIEMPTLLPKSSNE